VLTHVNREVASLRLRLVVNLTLQDYLLSIAAGREKGPDVAFTSHAQLSSFHCAVITDGLLQIMDIKGSLIPKLTNQCAIHHSIIKTLTGITRQAR